MDEVIISDEDRVLLGLWAADCAERALPLFETRAPDDPRPREAVDGVRDFARDGRRTQRLRTLAWAAQAAARDLGEPAAAAAARAACCAAATPYLHPLASPHQSKHILGPAVHVARARELAADGDTALADEEIRWAAGQAPPQVRALLRQMPARTPGRGRMDTLYHQLDVALRA